MPPDPLEPFLFLNQLQISSGKIRTKYDEKNVEIMPTPLKFFATSLPALVVGEENLVIGFGPPPHFRNASAIAGDTVFDLSGSGIEPRLPASISPDVLNTMLIVQYELEIQP